MITISPNPKSASDARNSLARGAKTDPRAVFACKANAVICHCNNERYSAINYLVRDGHNDR
jgi:hypothetical protein